MTYRRTAPSIQKYYGAQADEESTLYKAKDSLGDATYEVEKSKDFGKVGVQGRRTGRYLELAGLYKRYDEKQHSAALEGLGILQSMYFGGGNNWSNALTGSDDPGLLDYYLGFNSLGSNYSEGGE